MQEWEKLPNADVGLQQLTPRQRGLLSILQSLDPSETHQLEIQCRGDQPWSVGVIREGVEVAPVSAPADISNPLDIWDLVIRCADDDRLPEGEESQRLKTFGLFARPEEGAFMLRTRVPGGMVSSVQLRGLRQILSDWGEGHITLTTRGNFQIRGIRPCHAVDALMTLQDLGLTSLGAGANNVRNITASPTSGLDADEVIDVRPHVRKLHHYILHHPELFGLPHKFNLAFDNGSHTGVFADKNDLAFIATRIPAGFSIPEGVYFRVYAGARVSRGLPSMDTGLLVHEKEVVQYAASIVLLYKYRGGQVEKKSRVRLRDVLELQGIEKSLSDAAILGDVTLFRLTAEEKASLPVSPPVHSLIGAYSQKQKGKWMMGVSVPVGRLSREALDKLAALADGFGSGEFRLTAWQDLILPDVAQADVPVVRNELATVGLRSENGDPAGSVVACSGLGHCPYAYTDSKDMGMQLSEVLRGLPGMEGTAVNLNINSCANACAHHTFGEIGLLGVAATSRRPRSYHLFIGDDRPDDRVSSPLVKFIPETDLPDLFRSLLSNYLRQRQVDESFSAYAARVGRQQLFQQLSE